MAQSIFSRVLYVGLLAVPAVMGQYIGYSLTDSGDPDSAVYDTASTPSNSSTSYPPPDVFLNATVHVGEIDLTVTNITAKVNLQAEVLSLLSFNAGVDASIDRVRLLIQNVDAHVVLEARLSNLLLMITDVLNSIDLNPVIATLGQDVSQIINTTTGALGGSSTVSRRSFELEQNILYSINDYSGNAHTNRILAQDGNLVDQKLDNGGQISSEVPVGNYLQDMTFNGYNKSVSRGEATRELEYVYSPFPGLSVVAAVFTRDDGTVTGTQVLSESGGGGSSSISNDL
ncbi:hypothetical protein GLAREA_03620 [Glarea lozoyensis ATCC 20868]|uniref:Uncharacterized protein n=1 Tax=Glarea lozoyensis (strain ATCC 20868 / MF5171) TaxID=1116229 RepID=S3DW87_GLAL2|nr:uncharacterized protein GLAREA_03620 [Glarea lozoyensis ATCC 20868]EPE30653.1 hypothetical protein GLAREA_03620 [Glarea lozoyensis ATCC 20868]